MVTCQNGMFCQANAFNQTLCWDTSKVLTNMNETFLASNGKFSSLIFPKCRRTLTDGNIHYAVYNWVTNKSVTTTAYGLIRSWDTSRVTNMESLFAPSYPESFGTPWVSSFNADLTAWNTSQVTSMNGMFSGLESFNVNLSTWDTRKIVNMSIDVGYQ